MRHAHLHLARAVVFLRDFELADLPGAKARVAVEAVVSVGLGSGFFFHLRFTNVLPKKSKMPLERV